MQCKHSIEIVRTADPTQLDNGKKWKFPFFCPTLNVPSTEQCLHVLNNERFDEAVKLINSLFLLSKKLTLRSVCFK